MKFKYILLFLLIILASYIIYLLVQNKEIVGKNFDNHQINYYNEILDNKNNIENNNLNNVIKTGYNFQHGSENITRDYKKI